MWKEGTDIGSDVKELTEAVFMEMQNAKLNPNLISSFVHLMAETIAYLKYHDEEIDKELLHINTFKRFQKLIFLNHQHLNEKVLIPAEIMEI